MHLCKIGMCKNLQTVLHDMQKYTWIGYLRNKVNLR